MTSPTGRWASWRTPGRIRAGLRRILDDETFAPKAASPSTALALLRFVRGLDDCLV